MRRNREKVDPEAASIHRDFAGGLYGISMERELRGRAQSRQSSRIGWMTPISLLACIIETSAVSGSMRRRERCRCRRAPRCVDRQQA